jgi:lysophospholipase L1-like esterase
MAPIMKPLLLLCALLCLGGAFAASENSPQGNRRTTLKPLRGVTRILFLGDSITYAGGYVDALDAYLFLHDPDQHYELLNIGLPSETVSGLTEPNHAGGAFLRPDLHERLERALAKTKPDLVVACYGMNDGIYYPFDAARFAKYQAGITHLREQVQKAGARLWLLTPPPFDPYPIWAQTLPSGQAEYPSGKPFAGYDDVLSRYARWLLSQKRKGWNVINIHGPLNAVLRERRRSQPEFAFAGDGVHLNVLGQRLIAREILRAWGAPSETLPAPESPAAPESEIAALVHERQRLLTDAYLTEVGHKRPGMPVGVPVAEAQKRAAVLETQIREKVRALPAAKP